MPEREMTMIERVARAICLAELPTDSKWEWCVPAARAAIESLREPTEAMMEAGEKASYDYLPRHIAVTAYKAMVEAALKGGKE